METHHKGANEELSAAELVAWQVGHNRGRRFPVILANADGDEDATSFEELHGGVISDMTAGERGAYLRGFDAGRAQLGVDDDDDADVDDVEIDDGDEYGAAE